MCPEQRTIRDIYADPRTGSGPESFPRTWQSNGFTTDPVSQLLFTADINYVIVN